MTPGVFPKKPIFKTFLTFSGLESAKIASNQSKPHLKCRTHPCISLEAGLTTFFLKHAQKSKFGDSFGAIFTIPPLSAFRFLSFFFAFLFSLLPIFLLQLLAFYQASFEFKNFQESINQARNTCHGQAEGEKGKFSAEFLT